MCTRARESGSCTNTKTVDLGALEQSVLEGLCSHLAHPEVIGVAVREYHAEMRRLDIERSTTRDRDERKLADLRRSIDRLVDLVASGDIPGATVARKITEAEMEAQEIEDRLKAAEAPEVVALHPKVLDRYLEALSRLAECLAERQQTQALELVRELVDSVVVYEREEGEPQRFDVRGRLSALLNMADPDAASKSRNMSAGLVVPRDRIELPTRGFSILDLLRNPRLISIT